MNKQVTVNGMEVTAKSDATFLLVKQGTATVDAIKTDKKIADTAVNTSAELYPAAHDTVTAASTGISAIDAADSTVSTVKDIWYYRYSSSPDDYMGTNPTDITYIPTTDFDNYVLVNEFSLCTATGSNELSNLRVDSCTITTTGDQAVKVLVAGANGCEEFDGTGVATRDNGTVLQTASVTSDAVSTVKVYIYWDGNDTDVYTNGVADLLGTSVEVVFEGDVVPAATNP